MFGNKFFYSNRALCYFSEMNPDANPHAAFCAQPAKSTTAARNAQRRSARRDPS